MIDRRAIIAALTCALAVTGCGSKAKPAPTTANVASTSAADSAAAPAPAPAPDAARASGAVSDAEFEARMLEGLAMFTAMGDAVDRVGDDCGALADSLDQILAENRAFIDAIRAWKDDADMQAKGEAWMRGHQAEVMAPMIKVGGAGQKCSGDPKFIAVIEKLSSLGE